MFFTQLIHPLCSYLYPLLSHPLPPLPFDSCAVLWLGLHVSCTVPTNYNGDFEVLTAVAINVDRLCDPVVRVPEVPGLKRGPLSLVCTTEELLG
jgi:hypothetical protein